MKPTTVRPMEMDMQRGEIVLDTIVVDRETPPDPATVQALKQSIAEVGLLQPLVVQPVSFIPHLVCGHNRLAALRELGWDSALAVILPERTSAPDAATTAALAEIAENLHRREIDAIERAELVARWAEIVGRRHEKPRQDGAVSKRGRSEGRGNIGGTRQTARDLGVPEQTVRRSKSIAGLAPEAKKAAREAGLAGNQAALLSAAKAKTPEAQVAAIEQHDTETQQRIVAEDKLKRAVADLRKAEADAREADALPKAVPLSPAEKEKQQRIFGTQEDRAIGARIDEIIDLVAEQPPVEDAVQRIPPAERHAIDAGAIRVAALWLNDFADAWERAAYPALDEKESDLAE
jgi:ParB-like chromosome segregation protein Spo0J